MATFISKWTVLAGQTVRFPIAIGTILNIERLDWGDDMFNSYNGTVNDASQRPFHTYGNDGTYTVSTTSAVHNWSFTHDATSRSLLVSIDSYGTRLDATSRFHLDNTGSQFAGCTQLTTFPPKFVGQRQMILVLPSNCSNMFEGCVNINTDLTTLNVTNVQNMAGMFNGCTNFNGAISNWNVANVTNMRAIFANCLNFRQDISRWVLTSISEDQNAPSLSNDYINAVFPMFSTDYPNAWTFNAQVTPNVINNIITMPNIAYAMGGPTGLSLRYALPTFISTWSIADNDTVTLPIEIGTEVRARILWAGVTSTLYNLTIDGTGSNRPSQQYRFQATAGGRVILHDAVGDDGVGGGGPQYVPINGRIPVTLIVTGDLKGWSFATDQQDNTSSFLMTIEQCGGLELANTGEQFKNCTRLTSFPTTGPLLALPENCVEMFEGCSVLNCDLNTLNTSAATNMQNMFSGCLKFNGNISTWDVQNVTNMSGIFTGCTLFKRDVSNWRMTSIQNNASAPSFTNAYINAVKPKFSTGNPAAWNFTAPQVNADVLNFILPNINSRKLYYIDNDLRLRLRQRRRSRFAQSVITRSYNSVIKQYI